MSQIAAPKLTLDHLLDTRGVHAELGAYVVGVTFGRGSDAPAAFALGDGTVRLLRAGAWRTVAAHDGAAMTVAADPRGRGVVTGGADGRFLRITDDGGLSEIASFGSMKWVEHSASFGDGKAALLACTVGRHVHLYDGAGVKLKALTHPSTVTGIVFDSKGKRVVASHYNGASLWFVASKSDNPRLLEWKGSHTGVAISPDGDCVVTSMQENALHGWRLSDGQHMRMTGYPAKTARMAFTYNGKWLVTSGAEAIVFWPFFGGGPTGRAPTELGEGLGGLVTAVDCQLSGPMFAAGYSGGMVVVGEMENQRLAPVMASGRGSVSALAWSHDGLRLAVGTETGFAAVVDFTKR